MKNKILIFFELIKFEHTIFALPFAYMGLILAKKAWPGWEIFFWVTAAMVSARTAGMTLNRIIDRQIDAKNPRTKNRPIITGEFKLSWAYICVAAALVLFFLSAWRLNSLCFDLAPIAIVLLSGYHYVKRFSWLCHFSLGAVLAIAPIGGWVAVTGVFSFIPALLSMGVLFWVAGFDIIYSLQDVDFDKTNGLHSIPVKFGRQQSLKIAAYCHIATLVFLGLFGWAAHLGILYWVGVGFSAILLKLEHKVIADGDVNKINTAFFTINGWIGILLLIFTFLEIYR